LRRAAPCSFDIINHKAEVFFSQKQTSYQSSSVSSIFSLRTNQHPQPATAHQSYAKIMVWFLAPSIYYPTAKIMLHIFCNELAQLKINSELPKKQF
jgi:hypothetical protein